MKHVSTVLLIGMISFTSFATNEKKETAKESESASFQPKPLDDDWFKWLVGQWEGSVESDVGTGKIRTKIEFGLNGQFLIMKSEAEITEITDKQRQYLKETLHASDEYIEKSQNSIFEELQIHTIDPTTGEVVGYLFDGLRCIAEGRARRQGNKEIVEWKWSGAAQGVTSVCIIEKSNDNKIILNHKYTLLDGNIMEAKTEVTRKMETVKDSSSHSFYLEPLDDDEWSKWLVGEWKGTVGLGGVKSEAWREIEPGLNGQFLITKHEHNITDEEIQGLKEVAHISDEDAKKYQSLPFKYLEICTIDPKNGEVIGYFFDSMRRVAEGKGKLQGSKEIVEWQWFAQGQGAPIMRNISITERVSDDRFITTKKYTLPDGSAMEGKVEMTRKKMKTEK
jgi:hypothetical protein